MSDDDRRPNAEGEGDSDGNALADADSRAETAEAAGEPRRNWLRRIIGRGPTERKRLGEAVAALLGTALVALAAIVGLVIWHLIRRGRIIRERLGPPRAIRMPELKDLTGGLHDDQHDEAAPA